MKSITSGVRSFIISWCTIAGGVIAILIAAKFATSTNSEIIIGGILLLALGGAIQWRFYRRFLSAKRSMTLSLLNLQDGEFASTPATGQSADWNEMLQLITITCQSLHQQKQHMYHRELLFDRVMEQSSIAILLINDEDKLVYWNQSAVEYVLTDHQVMGQPLQKVLRSELSSLSDQFENAGEQLFDMMALDGHRQMWHLSVQPVQLGNEHHRLLLLQDMSEQFSRREVDALKRAIRVLNHELNNSIAPLSSLCHSGKQLAELGDKDKLNTVFTTFSNRIERLHQFIVNYSEFARLPMPKKETFQWQDLLQSVARLTGVEVTLSHADNRYQGDKAQLEQVFINLIKNAHEAGSDLADIEIQYKTRSHNHQQQHVIEVFDRGCGLSSDALENALLPFYSTKHTGSGVGLALCREIIQSHNGSLAIKNREHGGAVVRIYL